MRAGDQARIPGGQTELTNERGASGSARKPRAAGPSAQFVCSLCVIALIVLTAATFSNALLNGFVSFDDWFLVQESERIRSLSWENIKRIFIYQTNDTWLPLRELTYALDYHLWGLNPFGYHLTNVVFHVGSVVLVFFLALWVVRRPVVAFFAAAVFAVHPVQAESVTWVSGRRDVQYGFFYLLGLLAFVHHEGREGWRRWMLYALSLVFLLSSLLSKPSAMTFPAVLFLIALVFERGRQAPLGRLLACLPHAILTAGLVAVHVVVANRAGVVKGQALDASLANVPFILAKYLRLVFFPVNLSTPHGDLGLTWSRDGLLIGGLFLVVVGVAGVLWWSVRRRDVALFGLGWFFVSLLPVLNLVPLSALVAERYLYLPLIGLCVVGAESVGGLRRRKLAVACGVAIVAMLALLTHERNLVWRNGRTFWRDGVSKWPDIPITRVGLASEYVDAGRYELAWKEYMTVALAWGRAASTDPEHLDLVKAGLEQIYEHVARRRAARGDAEGALRVYETVVRIMPERVEPRLRLAEAYERRGMLAEARQQLLAAKRLAPARSEIVERLDRLEKKLGPKE